MIPILETLILFSINPIGFVIMISVLLFFEYLIGKSIMKDIRAINIKKIINYTKSYRLKLPLKLPPIASFELNAIDIFKNKIIPIKEASDTNGIISMNYIKINEWFN